jgi:hypothetical protein
MVIRKINIDIYDSMGNLNYKEGTQVEVIKCEVDKFTASGIKVLIKILSMSQKEDKFDTLCASLLSK